MLLAVCHIERAYIFNVSICSIEFCNFTILYANLECLFNPFANHHSTGGAGMVNLLSHYCFLERSRILQIYIPLCNLSLELLRFISNKNLDVLQVMNLHYQNY